MLMVATTILVACSPIVSTTSLVHSVIKGDAFGTVTGVVTKFTTKKDKKEKVPKKTRAEIMEDLRQALSN